jgi:hypothetical protein
MAMRPSLFAAALLVVLACPATVWACAGCRNPNVTPTRAASGPLQESAFTLTASLQSTAAWVSHQAGCSDLSDCDEATQQPEHSHDLFMLPIELTASLAWGVTSDLALETSLPIRMVHSTVSYATPDGRDYTPLDADVHHRDETLVGLGDGQLRARFGGNIETWWLSVQLGVSLPLGHIESDPFALGDAGLEHQHIQFGSGTFDPHLGLSLSRAFEDTQWSLYGQIQDSLYENSHGFRAGMRGLAGLSGGWKSSPGWLLSATLEGASEGAETWGGRVRQDGMLGRTEVLLGAQIHWSDTENTLSAALRAPVYRHLAEGEEDVGDLTSPLSLNLSAGWLF